MQDRLPEHALALDQNQIRSCRPHPISDFPKLCLTTDPNQQYIDFVPSRYEGRFAIVTSAGWDAVDADVPLTNGADAYGGVVWS
jgi:hypothetical protein